MLSFTSFKRFLILTLLVFLLIDLVVEKTGQPVRAKNGMVVTANEIASKTGVDILKRGGNAIDAAVAVGFTLAVTYPYAGNIGGGGFMVIHLKDGRNITIDYREKAPLAASRNMYLDKNNNFNKNLSSQGVTSVAVPGSVAGLIYALNKYGSMNLADVIQPAIDLAENGFPLDYNTTESIKNNFDEFKKYPSSIKIFSHNGQYLKEGEIFKQPDLAATLKEIKIHGKDGFYKGWVAGMLIKQIAALGGNISEKDLEKYRPVERKPVIGTYRGYTIVSMPPPSAGGIALIELLNILENFNFNNEEWGSSNYIHHLVEAMKYVYADRTKYLGDPDFVSIPENGLISKKYAKIIFGKINDKAIPANNISTDAPFEYHESNETNHYSIYDQYGNAVSATTTINSAYGSKIVVEGAGFLLNNEMDDFSAKPGVPNQFGLIGSEANSIQPGKRMLSSMTPTIVLKDNDPYLIIGSPGGSTIITVVLQVILNCIDFNMNIRQAIEMPRIHNQWRPDEIYTEQFGMPSDVKNNLIKMGYKFGDERTLGLAEGIMIDYKEKIIYGSSDFRGPGCALGY